MHNSKQFANTIKLVLNYNKSIIIIDAKKKKKRFERMLSLTQYEIWKPFLYATTQLLE